MEDIKPFEKIVNSHVPPLKKETDIKVRENKKREPFICSLCGKSFTRKYCLQIHLASHSAVRNHKCTMCSKTYKDQNTLRRHLEIHSKKIIHCEFCKKVFNRRSNYLTHVKSIHTDSSFPCTICGKVLRSLRRYKDHMKVHKNYRPYVCAHCNMSFNWKEVLIKHTRNHIPRQETQEETNFINCI